MVAAMVFCGFLSWIGWQWQIVRERESARHWLKERGGSVSGGLLDFRPTVAAPRKERNYDARLEPSWLRMMLGDQPFEMVDLPPTLTEPERQRMFDLFPEAEVQQWPLEGWDNESTVLESSSDK